MLKTKSREKKSKQLTYRQLVRKSCRDRRFARKIHKLVCKARGRGVEAAEAGQELDRIFKITPEDLKACCLERRMVTDACFAGGALKTRPTTLMLLDFAALV